MAVEQESFTGMSLSASDDAPPEQPDNGVSLRNALNDLTAREWIAETVSVWTQRGLGADHPDALIERQHPAPFSFTDVSRLIRFFTKHGMTVLDPFVGVGSTLKACALEGRNGIGFELNPRFAALARQRLEQETSTLFAQASSVSQTVMEGDARDLIGHLESESVDFLVTSPPYWGILNKKPDHKISQERVGRGLAVNYGDDPRDFANVASYETFVDDLAEFFGRCLRVLRRGRYCAVIVGDFRHGSRFYMLHADLARAMEQQGLVLKAVNVLYQNQKRVFPYGYPAAYVPNVHHQHILILQKDR